MSSQFQTDLEFMSEGARYVDQVAGKLNDDLSALMGRLGILEEDWQGRSGLKFDDLKIQFNAKMLELYRKLEELAKLVDVQAQAYGTAQQDQLFELGEVDSMLGGSGPAGGAGAITVALGRAS